MTSIITKCSISDVMFQTILKYCFTDQVAGMLVLTYFGHVPAYFERLLGFLKDCLVDQFASAMISIITRISIMAMCQTIFKDCSLVYEFS